ncbi:hypothetical protein D3C71_1490530 [compost metagenome]
MSWAEVGAWLKGNAGTGAALVGSLLTGNVPAAVAAGVSLVSSATGSSDPAVALQRLQSDPAAQVRLAELQVQEQASIRAHIAAMAELEYQNAANEHHETQETIRAADQSSDALVRSTRPLQSWASLIAAIAYVFTIVAPDILVLGALLTLPFTYAGLRGVDKVIDMVGQVKLGRK